MYIKPEELTQIQWEPTSYCNANCLVCPRTDKETMLTKPSIVHNQRHSSTDDIKAFVDSVVDDRLKSLTNIVYNGNIGDAMMHPNIDQILIDINKKKPSIRQHLHTNGGGPWDQKFEKIGHYVSQQNPDAKINFTFSIDGLEDTNHLYRRNVQWKHIVKNSKVLRKHKVKVRWRMNVFDHNRHQVDEARTLANSWGWEFDLNDGTWGSDQVNKFIHQPKNVELYKQKIKNWSMDFANDDYNITNDIPKDSKTYNDVCAWKVNREIQIVSDMSVWPCCWTSLFHFQYWLKNKNVWNNKPLSLNVNEVEPIHLKRIKQWEQLMNRDSDNTNSFMDLNDIKITPSNLLYDVLAGKTFSHINKNLKTDTNQFNLDICIHSCRNFGHRADPNQVPSVHKEALDKLKSQ